LFDIVTILVKIMAPILVYTAEEVWQSLPGVNANESIHTEDWPDIKRLKTKLLRVFNEKDIARWDEKLLPLRGCVLKELEEFRSKGVIGSSLGAKVILHSNDKEWKKMFCESKHLFDKLFIVSSVEIAEDLSGDNHRARGIPVDIKVTKADGKKCQRCWNYSLSVGNDAEHPGICPRCINVIEEYSVRE